MRATVVGLIALPVAAAGLALAVTALDPGNGEAPPTAAERTATASTGGGSDAAAETLVAAPEPAGTAIEGVRPHLTVIDGLSALPVPATIPSVLSTLAAQPADLAPLPTRTDGGTEPARSRAGAATGDGARHGRIRDTVDRGEPLGSAGSGEGDTPTDGTDPQAPRPGQDRPAIPSPMGDGPRGELPTGDGGEDEPAEGTPAPDDDGPPPLTDRPPLTGRPPLMGRPPLTSPGPPGGGTPPVGPPPHVVDGLPSPDAATPDRSEHPAHGDAPDMIGPVVGAPIVVPTPDVPADGEPDAATPADDGSEPR